MKTLSWQLQYPLGLLFGGGPKIIGGMTAAEMQEMTDKQNAYQKQADIDRQAALDKSEKDRMMNEKAAIDAAKQAELDKIASQHSAEQNLALEAASQEDAMATKKTGVLTSQFYDSLYSRIAQENSMQRGS